MPNSEKRISGAVNGIALSVRVTPRARKDEVIQVMEDGMVKIRLKAPPVGGKANQALIDFLSRLLDTPPSQIEIIAGHKSRNKLVSVIGIDSSAADRRLREAVSS